MNFGNYITQNSCPKSKAAQMIRGVPRGVAKRKTAIVATKLPTMWPRGKGNCGNQVAKMVGEERENLMGIVAVKLLKLE